MSKDSSASGLVSIVWLLIAVVLGIVSFMKSDDHEPAVKAAKAMGFRDVTVSGGHGCFSSCYGCGSDSLSYEVVATNSSGERVPLVVCCGAVLKGCTVRVP